MAKLTKSELEKFFRTGMRPRQEDFEKLIGAFTHSEKDIFVAGGGTDAIEDKKIGIGTTTPNQKLHVEGALQIGAIDNDANKTPGTVQFKDNKFQGWDGTVWKDLGDTGGASFWDKTGADPLSYTGAVQMLLDPDTALVTDVNVSLGANSGNTKIELFGGQNLGGDPISLGIGATEQELIFHLNDKQGSFDFYNDRPQDANSERICAITSNARMALGRNPTVPPFLTLEASSNSRRGAPAIGCMRKPTGSADEWSYLVAEGQRTGIYWKNSVDFLLASEAQIPTSANPNNNTPVPTNTTYFIKCRQADKVVEMQSLEVAGINVPSDQRLKNQISPFGEGLQHIKKLETVRFQYNANHSNTPDNWHLGITAQNLQQVLPELVVATQKVLNEAEGETEVLSIKFNELIYLAFNAIKELDAKIEQLQKLVPPAGTATSPGEPN